MIKVIDIPFQDQPGVIATYLVETKAGPVLVETGPHSTIEALSTGLNHHGYGLSDVKKVFVTHIHLDHAGAAWVFAEHGATIFLHPVGIPHLQNPEKLVSSAKRIYKEKMDSLWGELRPIPGRQLKAVPNNEKVLVGGVGFRARHTPGHAVHHVVWEVNDVAFTGDVGGVKIGENGPVMPPCPPPDINLEDWIKSLHFLRARRYRSIYLTHFGRVDQAKSHFIELEGRLLNWANWIKPYWQKGTPMVEVIPLFQQYVKHQLEISLVGVEDLNRYELANPADMSVAGLYRYWSKYAPTL